MADERKFKIITVTMTQDYAIEMYDDKRTKINGWTIQEVIDDWFRKYSLRTYHATRETHEIQGARKFIEAEVKVLE